MFNIFKKCECKNENLYKKVVETVRSSLDIKQTKQTIITVIGKILDADRCFIMEYDKKTDRFKNHDEEYLSSTGIKSYKNFDFEASIPHFINEFKQGKTLIYNQDSAQFNGKEINFNDKNFEEEKRIVQQNGVNSGVVYPIYYAEEFLGDIVVHYVDKKQRASEDEINLIKVVAGQLAVALYQSNLFDKLKEQNDIQNAILNNIPFMAWLKDSNSKFIMVNKKMAELYGVNQDDFIGKDDRDFTPEVGERYIELDLEVMQKRETLVLEEYVINKGEKRWAETFKSPIIDASGNVLGTAGLAHDITDRKKNELELLRKQEEIIQFAQREKISRNIIEILRSSLDKKIIVKQFVKNIGNFFNADRVFLAAYDKERQIYLPVEPGCEYLSSNNEKSFVGYDWTKPEATEYIKPMLEKREFKIPDWSKYIEQNPNYSENFKKLFQNSNVKSSYNFPVLHQTEIMGYFCIEFTQRVYELTEEDIERIRSICTQAAIALYQADLYTKAQAAIDLKDEFISKTIIGAQNILNNIKELYEAMSNTEAQCEKHIAHLNQINENLQMLLRLVNELIGNENKR